MTIKQIKELVETETNVLIDQRDRHMDKVSVRFMFYYLCMKHAEGYVNESAIAKYTIFDRTTILNGVNEFPNLLNYDSSLRQTFNKLEAIIAAKGKSFYKESPLVDIDKIKLIRTIQKKQIINNKLRDENSKLLHYKNKYEKLIAEMK